MKKNNLFLAGCLACSIALLGFSRTTISTTRDVASNTTNSTTIDEDEETLGTSGSTRSTRSTSTNQTNSTTRTNSDDMDNDTIGTTGTTRTNSGTKKPKSGRTNTGDIDYNKPHKPIDATTNTVKYDRDWDTRDKTNSSTKINSDDLRDLDEGGNKRTDKKNSDVKSKSDKKKKKSSSNDY